ncbi:hypothetical protein AMATHDRAFT_8008 [Amanita thiersii Skay4041]|uniref:DNA sliding clamp PCNA n=1 Tax=Amanita thiersii Skay4041 TaxID=703135 RepID=A0A2A9NEZ9_9AGAR|nr:hypothetical protein AMATHDRAFT_8008 [Amanita thiersii Skay4041]
MLEAKLAEAGLLKKLLDAIKELVTDANFECNEEGINLQAMDNSHVALVAVLLQASGFQLYRCDRPMPLGVNLNSFGKVLKCAKDDDICTLKAADQADVLNLVYEAKHSDRVAEYDMKLMDIDAETLGIPDTDYDARVTMPSSEFTRIVRDLSQLGESVRIEVSKEGIRFTSEGEAANGNVLLRQSESAGAIGKVKKQKKDNQEEGSSKKKVKKEDGDVNMNDEEEQDENESEDGEEERDEEEDEEESGRKRKKKANGSAKPAKKAKTSKKKAEDDDDESSSDVIIELNQHVSLTFSLKYLANFSRSANVSQRVQLMMSNDVPLLVSYDFEQGHIRYYLAPKIGDD